MRRTDYWKEALVVLLFVILVYQLLTGIWRMLWVA